MAVSSQPQRIVSLSPSNTEILGALGLIDQVVGVTDYSNYPAEAATKTNVGGYTAINSEKVVALNPDLIIADSGNGNETIEYLRGLGLNVVVLNPTDIEGIFKDIVLVGKATGTEDKANSLVNSMSDRINSIKEKVATSSTKPTVSHGCQASLQRLQHFLRALSQKSILTEFRLRKKPPNQSSES